MGVTLSLLRRCFQLVLPGLIGTRNMANEELGRCGMIGSLEKLDVTEWYFKALLTCVRACVRAGVRWWVSACVRLVCRSTCGKSIRASGGSSSTVVAQPVQDVSQSCLKRVYFTLLVTSAMTAPEFLFPHAG